MRHTYATHLLHAGAPLPGVAANPGHSDTRLTQRHCAHLVPSHVAQVVRASMPKLGLVQAEVIALLRRPEGVTVDEIRAVTGWQAHTLRGVFSGALEKKLGLAIAATNEERGRVYRIAEARA